MLEPKLLVLDEPTSNLDYRAIRELHDMIAKKKAEGTTIVIAEHRLAWIADIADRFCCFENGILAGQWTTAEFKALPVEALSGKDFIVLDEPTSGLDYYHMTQVAKLLQQLKEQGAAVLVITHDEELAAGWCDRVIYLQGE